MKRSPLRRTPMRRRHRSTSYSRRPRDIDFMLFVKTLLCSVVEEWPSFPTMPTPCNGPIEADHDSRGHGLGQKSADSTCIPACTQHHRERTDHTGTFKHLKRDQARAWFDRAQLRTKTMWAEHHGEVVS